jgi:hypothetical protein
VLLQRRGAAGFAILTEPFADQVDRVMAYHRTDRDLPAVVLEHPTQNLIDAEALEARAEALAAAAVRLLRGEWDTP